MSEEIEKKGVGAGAWVWLILGILYAVSPVDILPDVVPVAGWVDDLVITGSGVLNFVQAKVGEASETLASYTRHLQMDTDCIRCDSHSAHCPYRRTHLQDVLIDRYNKKSIL